jgi:hypothetical protein
MASIFSLNDGVLFGSLLYLSIDMQYQWPEFEKCHWPVHTWLLVSYIFILVFRLAHILGTAYSAADSGDFLLNLRHKHSLPLFLMSLTWLLVLPLFMAWTGLGTFWLYDSKRLSSRCLPFGMPLCFIIVWQLLSYAWILIHSTLGGIAWVLEGRLRRTEASLRAMEDPDTVARWGEVSSLPAYTALASNSLGGLSPDQIKALPGSMVSYMQLGEETECSICLTELQQDDFARQLSGCGHTFHRSCIDLWLLRRADCPLCKQSVLPCDNAGIRGASVAPMLEPEHWHV